jgi:hypothetical protein
MLYRRPHGVERQIADGALPFSFATLRFCFALFMRLCLLSGFA